MKCINSVTSLSAQLIGTSMQTSDVKVLKIEQENVQGLNSLFFFVVNVGFLQQNQC